MKKYFCEFLGTTILVFFGCGTYALAGSYVGAIGISFAFGLAFLAAACIISPISGCHINPTVSLAMLISKKINLKNFIGYVCAQFLGALFGSFLLTCIITSANVGSVSSVGLATNGFKEFSSVNLSLEGAILIEIILTIVFVLCFLRIKKNKDTTNMDNFQIALVIVLIHLIGIPLTGTSINPARSLAPAILIGGKQLTQVWVFIISPLIGATIAAFINKFLFKD